LFLLRQNLDSGVLGEATISAQTASPLFLFDTEDYYFEMAKNGEQSLFTYTQLQPDGGLGAKPPEAEAVFRFQRVISTLKHRSGRQ